MGRFIVRRSLSAVALLFAVSVVVFLIFAVIPSYDPAAAIAGRTASPQDIAAVRHDFGFDQPVYVQYGNTMKNIFTGQVVDYQSQLNVVDQFKERFPATLSLVLPAAILWLGVGILFGVISGVRAGRWADRYLTVMAMLGVSIPVFLLAALFLYVFAYQLHWFPNTGYTALTQNPADWAYHLILPWVALAILFVGFYSRVLRSNVLDTINQDFVRTAKAKGLSQRRILLHHVLRNSVMPIITLFGLDFAAALGGATLVTESVFNIPGIGQYEAQAIAQLNVPPILVGAIFTAFFVVVFSALVDVVYALVDPRVRLTG
jgi:peptide/nickel transport system permease protein